MMTTQTTNMKRFLMTFQLSLVEDQTSYHQVNTPEAGQVCSVSKLHFLGLMTGGVYVT